MVAFKHCTLCWEKRSIVTGEVRGRSSVSVFWGTRSGISTLFFWFRLSCRPSVKGYTHCRPHWQLFHGYSCPPGSLPKYSCSVGRGRLYLVTVNENSNFYGEDGLYFSILNPSGISTCCHCVSLFCFLLSFLSHSSIWPSVFCRE